MAAARTAAAVLVFAVGGISVATLLPTAAPPADTPTCFLCNARVTADILANVILFTPLGIGFGLLGFGIRRSLGLGAALACCVELLQFSTIPGRDAAIGDLVFDTLGTGAGLLIVASAVHWIRPSARRSAVLSLAAAISAAAVFTLTGYLLTPALPRSTYHGQWTPNITGLEWYRGHVLGVTLGSSPLPPKRLSNSDSVRNLLLDGASLDVLAIAGPRIPRLGSLFSIYDDAHRQIILLGPDRDDLVFRYRTRASVLRLDQPRLRSRGLMLGVSPGDTLRIRVWRDRHYCIEFIDVRACPLGFTIGSGWGFLLYVDAFPRWLTKLLDVTWVAGLLVPFGYWARPRGAALTGGALVLTALAVGPSIGNLLPTPWLEWLGAISGASLGHALRKFMRAS